MIDKDGFEFDSKNHDKSSLSELQFIFSQAERHLKETVETSNSIVTRSVVLLSLCVGFIVPLIGYVVSTYTALWQLNTLFFTCIGIISYLTYILIKLRFNIKGHGYFTLGSQPVDLLHDWFYYTYPNEKKREIMILIREIKSYQRRMKANKDVNEDRWKVFTHCLNCIAWLPVFIMVLVFLCLYLGL